mmetsp:Transcript_77611/g.240473  ORF Transcript_77611/g.240473 Transcript_77611/m.240473 type:complete len:170 (-) Transcript_77611:58-567(-)
MRPPEPAPGGWKRSSPWSRLPTASMPAWAFSKSCLTRQPERGPPSRTAPSPCELPGSPSASSTSTGRAGIQIYFLAQQCVKSGADDRKKCALNVFNVISSFSWAAQFLAQVAVDCPRVANAAAASCAAVVSDFVAAVAALGPLVNGIGDDCQPPTGEPAELPPGSGAFE